MVGLALPRALEPAEVAEAVLEVSFGSCALEDVEAEAAKAGDEVEVVADAGAILAYADVAAVM